MYEQFTQIGKTRRLMNKRMWVTFSVFFSPIFLRVHIAQKIVKNIFELFHFNTRIILDDYQWDHCLYADPMASYTKTVGKNL